MKSLHLYHNIKNEPNAVVASIQTSNFSLTSDIYDGMTTKQIANAISDKLISHIDKALETVRKIK